MTKTAIIMLLSAGMVSIPAFASHWNGGRNVPVHKITLVDPEGETISPTDQNARPISTENTCGRCHDVGLIKNASLDGMGHTHFDGTNAARLNLEPWILVDEKTGTQLPMSLDGLMQGTFRPWQVGMTAWEWTKTFGRHFPGGGYANSPSSLAEEAGDRSRWFVTGGLEPNCFACHAQNSDYDHSEWVRQIHRENFQGAATAALGIAEVEGMNSRMPAYWHWSMGENKDDKLFAVPMKTVYDVSKFDGKNRVRLEIGKPKNENCLACHSVTEKGMGASGILGDAHLRAGMKCIDCHRSGMDHRMKTVSCGECHIGDAEGKRRGPKPKHTGIPLVHFEKLSCTVCHSGVTAGGKVAEVRTSRANRIGVYGRAQWDTEAPYVLEPVFAKVGDKIKPCRIMWPAYFAEVPEGKEISSGSYSPMLPEQLMKDAGEVFNAATNGISQAVVSAALAKLGATNHVYIANGRVWWYDGDEVDGKSTLRSLRNYAHARPIVWPFAHDVKAGGSARGAGAAKCSECHNESSEFFLGKVCPTGPLTDAFAPETVAVSNAKLMQLDGTYHQMLGFTFRMRPLFKVVLWVVFGFLCLVAAAATAVALPRVFAKLDDIRAWPWRAFVKLLDLALCVSGAYLVLSGVVGWMVGGMTSWWLMLHMVAGGAFAASVFLLAAIRFRSRSEGMPVVWALFALFAGGVVFTAVMPMMSVFGTHGQEVLLWCHRCVSLSFVVVAAVCCAKAIIARKAKRD